MAESTDIKLYQQNEATVYRPSSFERAMTFAELVVNSKFNPNINNVAQAFLLLATGDELGLTPMQSIRALHVVEGRPCPSADLLVALVLRSGKAAYIHAVEETADSCLTAWTTNGGHNQMTQREPGSREPPITPIEMWHQISTPSPNK